MAMTVAWARQSASRAAGSICCPHAGATHVHSSDESRRQHGFGISRLIILPCKVEQRLPRHAMQRRLLCSHVQPTASVHLQRFVKQLLLAGQLWQAEFPHLLPLCLHAVHECWCRAGGLLYNCQLVQWQRTLLQVMHGESLTMVPHI